MRRAVLRGSPNEKKIKERLRCVDGFCVCDLRRHNEVKRENQVN